MLLQAMLFGPHHNTVAVSTKFRVLAALWCCSCSGSFSGSFSGASHSGNLDFCGACSFSLCCGCLGRNFSGSSSVCALFSGLGLGCFCFSCFCLSCFCFGCFCLSCGSFCGGCSSGSCGCSGCGGWRRKGGDGIFGHSIEGCEIEVARRSSHLLIRWLVWVFRFKQRTNLVDAVNVVKGNVHLVPEAVANSLVQSLVKLHTSCVNELVVVFDSRNLIQSHGTHNLNAVGAIALSGGRSLASASGLLLVADRILLSKGLGLARTWQSIPLGFGVARVIAREGEHAKVVAAHKVPKPLVVQIAAPWTRTLSGIVGEARTKIHTQLPQGCGGFGVDLVPDELGDVELSWSLKHHLVVNVPQGASQISHVDIVKVLVALLRRSTVDIEGELCCIAGLLECLGWLVGREGPILLSWCALGEEGANLDTDEAGMAAGGSGVVHLVHFIPASALLIAHKAALWV
mmetsp:Transcript_23734/g.49297  ORF Transcript_23734/g.49297 Transcript_23734/m.49297 type:complete len:457 (+) Transcript_23734:387-1757(+)